MEIKDIPCGKYSCVRDILERENKRLQEQCRNLQWQPIETLKPDESWLNGSKFNEVKVILYVNGEVEYTTVRVGNSRGFWWSLHDIYSGATHWMPWPEPPQIERE